MFDFEYKQQDLADSFLLQLARAMGFPQISAVKTTLEPFFGKTAHRLASVSIELDRKVDQYGPVTGVRWLLKKFVASFSAQSVEEIPQTGPLIIAANHPSSYDALVILASLNRADCKLIIGDIPPYHFLPNVCQYAIFAPPVSDTFGRMRVIRDAIGHLQEGGALLIFPRGNIEPDPACMPNPDAEFDKWSRSLEIFLHRVPKTRVQVAIVSGVISQVALRHPLTWFRKSQPDRQRWLTFTRLFVRF